MGGSDDAQPEPDDRDAGRARAAERPAADDDDAPAGPPRNVEALIKSSKLEQFKHGIHKKSKFQIAKEEAEAKRKREAEEAARVYEDFVASFDEGDRLAAVTNKGWVKGATIKPNNVLGADDDEAPVEHKPKSKLFIPGGGLPSAAPKTTFGGSAGLGSMVARSVEDEWDAPARPSFVSRPSFAPPAARPPPPREPSPPPAAGSSRKRNLDTFMEQLKKEQAEREARAKKRQTTLTPARLEALDAFDKPGSHDTGDPNTTNLYLGNLPLTISEPHLLRLFSKFGPIASLKVMWPRTEEERTRGRLSGFISFMTRKDAANALKEMDGKELDGHELRMGWGKAVPIPSHPIFVAGAGSGPGAGRSAIRVEKPPEDVLWRIHRIIERVIRYGPSLESAVIARERGNPDSQFTFLWDHESPNHLYYRWKLYSILQGDPKEAPRTSEFAMYEGGPRFIPPSSQPEENEIDETEILETTDSESDGEEGPTRYRDLKGAQRAKLPARDRRKLTLLLRRIDLTRVSIAKPMIFCLDRADAAEEISSLLVRSLLLPGTPIWPTKIARLWLINDILHNAASTHSAWKFRTILQTLLSPVFADLGEHYRKIGSRLKAEQMRKAVMGVVEGWEAVMVFPAESTAEWRILFEGFKEKVQEKEPEGGAVPAKEEGEKEEAEEDLDGVPLSKFAPIGGKTEAEDDEDLDGVPIAEDEDLDGAPMNKDDDDLDGAPIVANQSFVSLLPPSESEIVDEDLDGVPMLPGGEDDDDLDGVPMA